MKKQEVANLIKETIENKLFEHKLKQQVNTIYESRQDLQSVMLLSMMEELSGKKIPDPTVLDEGVWDKAKAMLAKIRLSKSTGAAQQRDALEQAANDAANKKFSEMFGELKKMDGFEKYPNNESEQEFVGITTAIGLIYEAVKEAHQNGMLETETANGLINKLKAYADGLEGDLSYSYRYFNEDEEADGETIDEEGTLEEDIAGIKADNVSLRFIDRFFKAAAEEAAGGKPIPPRMLRRMGRMNNRLAKEIETKGFENLGPKERRAWEEMTRFRENSSQFDVVPDPVKKSIDKVTKAPQDGGGGGGGAQPDGGGGAGDPGPDAPGLGQSMMGDPSVGIGDISGITSLPKLYAKAGSMAALETWMGGPFLGQLAAFALPAAAIAGIAGLVGKRLMGKSREGSLKKLSAMMAPVDPSEQGTDTPEPVAGGADAGAEAGADAAADAAAGAAAGAGAAAAGAGGEKYGQHVTKWIAAGEPDMDEWAKTNRGRVYPVTRESDSYVAGSDPDGPGPHSGKLKPKALELAKAQLAWMQKNKPNSPDIKLLAKSIKDTENYDAEHGDAAKDDDTISDDEITKGVSSTPDFGGLAETVSRWQQIAGIIKG